MSMLKAGHLLSRVGGGASPWLNLTRCSSSFKPIMAIRREDNSVWERRAPLAPSHVRKLVKQGVKVIVQPSNRRAYPMQSYANVGAHIQEDLSEATLIVGVKSVPIDLLEPNKTYAFFSHTIKAQEANMPLLDAILEKQIRLIDYERMVDENNVRKVAFGKYAGVAGMINILHGLGLRLLALGHHTPFMHIGPAHNYRNSEMAKQAIRDAGYEISLGLMPKSLGPLTFVFTGSGNVSQGAQEVFQGLPYEYVDVDHLSNVAKNGATNKVYACEVSRRDHLVRKEGGGYNKDEFLEFPERYASMFSIKIAPYASVIVNGIYFAPNAPRLISLPDAKNLLQPQRTPWLPSSTGCPHLPHRLVALCDISADPGGSIEFMQECTTIDSPFCLYDAESNMNKDSFAGDGVMICSIDNMPTQIPRESTDFFGELLLPYMEDLLKSDATQPFEAYDVSPVVKSAVITSNGVLTPNFRYIDDLRKANRRQKSRHKVPRSNDSASRLLAAREAKKSVLILGAGYVSAPCVDYLTRDGDIAVTVASEYKHEVDYLANKFDNVTPANLEVHRSQEELESMIADHNVVISLLPYGLHPEIAKLCIKHKTNMVTASYRTPQMRALEQDMKDAGILVVNEVGVDPGIDHMLAMQIFDEVKQHGGKVTSFVSYCGGLPAPECSENPLRYKFSWSPRGVLYNVLQSSRYLLNGKRVDIHEGGGLLDIAERLNFLPGFNIEGFPNRDSEIYRDIYGIKDAHTILRGTIRYTGFCQAMKAILKMGLLDPNPHASLHPAGPDVTWKEFMCEQLGQSGDILYDSFKSMVYDNVEGDIVQLQCLEQLGLMADEQIDKKGNPLDTLSNYLAKKLSYQPGERDLIVMRHDISIEWPDHSTEERAVDLVVYGEPHGYSAMAATVGFPTGIATKMVLEGEIQGSGLMVPLTSDIYRPILKRLKKENIEATEIVTHNTSDS